MVGVAGGVIWQVCDDLVPEPLVKGSGLETERGQKDAPAPLRPRLVFGGFEELPTVSLAAEGLRHPKRCEVEPPSPDVAQSTPELRAPFVAQKDGERAVVRVPGDRHVRERQALPGEGGILGTRRGSEVILKPCIALACPSFGGCIATTTRGCRGRSYPSPRLPPCVAWRPWSPRA